MFKFIDPENMTPIGLIATSLGIPIDVDVPDVGKRFRLDTQRKQLEIEKLKAEIKRIEQGANGEKE